MASILKIQLSNFIHDKFKIYIPPEEIKQVRHRSCTDVRIYMQDNRGGHYECFWTITELWKYRATMGLVGREFTADDRPYRKPKPLKDEG